METSTPAGLCHILPGQQSPQGIVTPGVFSSLHRSDRTGPVSWVTRTWAGTAEGSTPSVSSRQSAHPYRGCTPGPQPPTSNNGSWRVSGQWTHPAQLLPRLRRPPSLPGSGQLGQGKPSNGDLASKRPHSPTQQDTRRLPVLVSQAGVPRTRLLPLEEADELGRDSSFALGSAECRPPKV